VTDEEIVVGRYRDPVALTAKQRVSALIAETAPVVDDLRRRQRELLDLLEQLDDVEEQGDDAHRTN
jgi:uncharacterized membrane protein